MAQNNQQRLQGYRIKIKLPMMKVIPDVTRTVDIPAQITFDQLDSVIEVTMGWWEGHLYEFSIPKANLKIPEMTTYMQAKDDPFFGSSAEQISPETKIDEYLMTYKKFKYVYDFGDNWEHEVRLMRVLDDYSADHPILVKAVGECPPEDSGGVPGWLDMLDAYNDPKHPDHQDVVDWLTESDQLPADREIDIDKINAYMADNFRI